LKRAVTFHIDGVSEIAVICWEYGNHDAAFMVVGCFIDSIANRRDRRQQGWPPGSWRCIFFAPREAT
jgi:hypothetical protein